VWNLYISGSGNSFPFLVYPYSFFLSFFCDSRSPALLLYLHLPYEKKIIDIFCVAVIFLEALSLRGLKESSLTFKDSFFGEPHMKVQFRGEPLCVFLAEKGSLFM
jgi:hypothetical protein